MQLYNYFRSSASYRVRIALALKGLRLRLRARCTSSRTSSSRESFRALSPSQLVPALMLDEPVDRAADPVAGDHRVPRRDASPSRRCCPPTRSAAPGCARSRSTSPARSIRSTTCACCATWSARSEASRTTTRTAGTAIGSRPAWKSSSASSPAARDRALLPRRHARARRLRARAADLQRPAHGLPARSRADGDARLRGLHGRAGVRTTQPSACPDAA